MPTKHKLLVVEDEEPIRIGLTDVLVFHGFDVVSAADGRDGLHKALTGRFDLILLDLMLPGIDGYEVCERVRAQDPDQPIIMLTARGADEDIIRGLKLGADDYVAKPFSVAQLVLRVQAVLRRARPEQAMPVRFKLDDGTEIDADNLCACRAEACIAVTRREMELLQYLAANADRAVGCRGAVASGLGLSEAGQYRDPHRGHPYRQAASQAGARARRAAAADHRARRRLSTAAGRGMKPGARR
jgi:DNA-binding response OmpR family regulator